MSNYTRQLRQEVDDFLASHFPTFKFVGRSFNVGTWETTSPVNLTKRFGDSFDDAECRLLVYLPGDSGQQVKVEMNFRGSGWETMFNGFVANIREIGVVFKNYLGISEHESGL